MITASFTNPQNALQTDAVIFVRNANFSKQISEHHSLDSNDFTTVVNPTATESQNIRFSVYYWMNAEAKDLGAAPYTLENNDNQMDTDFAFQPGVDFEGLTLEEKCEKHLLDVVLPPMQ